MHEDWNDDTVLNNAVEETKEYDETLTVSMTPEDRPFDDEMRPLINAAANLGHLGQCREAWHWLAHHQDMDQRQPSCK